MARYKTLAESNQAMMGPQYRPWSEINPSNVPRPTYRSRAEILDEIIDRFNRQPVRYQDIGSKTIASKSMAPIEMPQEMAGARKLNYLFDKPLTFNWAIPRRRGALATTRTLPQSDYARQMAYSAGVTGGGQRISALKPASYWPETSFKLPERGMFPPFGGTVDFTAGRATAKPIWGTHGGVFAPFEPKSKQVPRFGGMQWPSQTAKREAKGRLQGFQSGKKGSRYLNLFYKKRRPSQGTRLRSIK